MKTKNVIFMLTVLILWSLTPTMVRADGIVTVDGSSTVYPITEAVAEEFQAVSKGATKVTVGISGTGGGFKKFCRGELDISDASRPIKASEMASCREGSIRPLELPVAIDALTVVINPKNTWATTMTVEELMKIWEPAAQGTVTRWNQVRADWPDKPLTLFGPGSDSGTFDYFTEAIVGTSKASRGDYTASEDDNTIVQGVVNDPNALGYFGLSYYLENQGRLKAVAIDSGKGPVAPSRETVDNGTYSPLSRPIFIYVSKKGLERPEVAEFVQFYIKNAGRLSLAVKYIPLTSGSYATVQGRLDQKLFGTSFANSKPGTRIDSLLAQSPRW